MLQVLSPTYTFKVTVTGNSVDGGWNGLEQKSGVDPVWEAVRKALHDAGLKAEVFFERFEHK